MDFKIFVKLFILMVVFSSCGKMENLTSFSKRKYLKNFPKQNVVKEKKTIEYKYIEEQEFYAGAELKPEAYLKSVKKQLQKPKILLEKTDTCIYIYKPYKSKRWQSPSLRYISELKDVNCNHIEKSYYYPLGGYQFKSQQINKVNRLHRNYHKKRYLKDDINNCSINNLLFLDLHIAQKISESKNYWKDQVKQYKNQKKDLIKSLKSRGNKNYYSLQEERKKYRPKLRKGWFFVLLILGSIISLGLGYLLGIGLSYFITYAASLILLIPYIIAVALLVSFLIALFGGPAGSPQYMALFKKAESLAEPAVHVENSWLPALLNILPFVFSGLVLIAFIFFWLKKYKELTQ